MSYFDLAKSASLLSTHPKHKMGAVIVNKKPISVGCNLYKSHPKYADGQESFSIHAEIKAIMSSPRSKLEGSEIWVYRQDKEGNPAMAKPCLICQKYIIEAGIKKVYFTTEKGFECMEL